MTSHRKPLPKVEMARGFAAFYVLTYDIFESVSGKLGLAGVALRFGPEAVMLFFVISGFVIAYSVAQKEMKFREYFVRRFRRIYPLFLVALLLGAADYLFFRKQPVPVRELFGNLFMLQDLGYLKPGTWFAPFAGIAPLWSLAYEWWFYMLFFPVWTLVPKTFQLPVVTAISTVALIAYVHLPNQICAFLMYFILWWTGVELAREFTTTGKVTFAGQRNTILSLGSFAVVSVFFLMRAPVYGAPRWGGFPTLQIRQIVSAFVVLIGALAWNRAKWIGFAQIFRPFLWVAPISYAIYLFHVPLLVNTDTYLGLFESRAVQLFVGFTVLLVFSIGGELYLQPWINRFLTVSPVRKAHQ